MLCKWVDTCVHCSRWERPFAAAAAAAVACTSEEGIRCSGSFCPDPLGSSSAELLPGWALGSASTAQHYVATPQVIVKAKPPRHPLISHTEKAAKQMSLLFSSSTLALS
jgi:hypothetical protein